MSVFNQASGAVPAQVQVETKGGGLGGPGRGAVSARRTGDQARPTTTTTTTTAAAAPGARRPA
jgi:hypothetical protein